MNKQSNMNDIVASFFKLSVQYERSVKRKLVSEVISKIKPYVTDDEVLKEIQKSVQKHVNEKNKEVANLSKFRVMEEDSNNHPVIPRLKTKKVKKVKKEEKPQQSRTPDVNLSNMKKFLLKELKYNMPITTPLSDRFDISNEILRLMRKENLNLDGAKQIVYKKHNIFITHPVEYDTMKTDENNMDVEREYDELRGSAVYGWDDDGEALYEPTFGANITPPTHKNAGYRWRAVLENRWEQRSTYDCDEELDTYIGN